MKTNEKYSKSMSRDYHFAVVEKLEKEIVDLKKCEELYNKQEVWFNAKITELHELTKSICIKHELLKIQLQREKDCVDFYAEKSNWIESGNVLNQKDKIIFDKDNNGNGGKLARSVQGLREKK